MRRVEAQRRRQAERVHRAVRQAVAAAERLRHRVREPETGERERLARRRRAAEQLRRAPRSAGSSTTRGSERGDQRRALERARVARVVPAAHVERLGAVRERVHRRADRARRAAGRASARRRRRSRRGSRRRRRRPSAGRACGPRTSASTRRRSTSSAPRRPASPVAADAGLRGVDRRAAADREERVGVGRNLDPVRRHLRPAGDARHVERVPARARDEERPLEPELGEHRRQLGERPADDHASRGRANSTNACAARVSARPLARTR